MSCQSWLAVRPRLFEVPPATPMTSVTLRVFSSEGGAVIGKGGNKVRETREVTKARMNIGNKEGNSDRFIKIEGIKKEVLLANILSSCISRDTTQNSMKEPSTTILKIKQS